MKKTLLKLGAIALILIIPAINLFVNFNREAPDVSTSQTDISALKKLSDGKVSAVEKKIEKTEAQKQEQIYKKKLLLERAQNREKLLEQVKEGKTTYRQIFSDTLIVGDSLMNGLEIYDILDSANMITKVGASLYHLDDNIKKIISYSPKVLILHYGVNMIEDRDYFIDNFINMYTDCINKIKKGTPETKIVVSGMFPVSSKGIENEPVLANCPKYEKKIREMCSLLGVTYLDNTETIQDGSGYYDLDGIHVKRDFYTDVWLVYVATELGL
ncbi:MAG: hypothetical protein MJ177_04750 [Clostridia bacterium]|nr:hypothetical protein [Clostridia bacterium]